MGKIIDILDLGWHIVNVGIDSGNMATRKTTADDDRGPFYLQRLSKPALNSRISNYTDKKLWNFIDHACPNFNGGSAKYPLNLGLGKVIFSVRSI